MGTQDTEPRTPVKTAQTTFRVVEALKELDGGSVTELANHLDLPKSSAHNYLRTLDHEGYVVESDGQYRVGLRFLDLGAYARTKQQLYSVAAPELEKVADGRASTPTCSSRSRGSASSSTVRRARTL